jgi:hypothetical protein
MSTSANTVIRPQTSLPTYGSTFGIALDSGACALVDSHMWAGDLMSKNTRERVSGDVTSRKDAFPGTSAWRPPIC